MSFRYSSALPSVSNANFESVVPFGGAILGLFRDFPELLDAPYALWELDAGGEYVVDAAAFENRVVQGLHERSVNIDAMSPESDFEIWKSVRFPDPPPIIDNRAAWLAMNIRAYALVDLSIYYVRIANIYLPNSGLIKNLYATNVETDAIGRLNEQFAREAVQKLVRRYPIRVIDEKRISEHVLILMKHEISSGTPSVDRRGVAFERECSEALKSSGFEVRETIASGDFGADLIAFKDGLAFAIQCKDTSKPVGVKAVQEAVAARSHYKVDYAAVCSTARFTDAAVELATSNNVLLTNVRNLAARLDAI